MKARENTAGVGVIIDLFIIFLCVNALVVVVVLMLRELRRVAEVVDFAFCGFFAVVLFFLDCVVLR